MFVYNLKRNKGFLQELQLVDTRSLYHDEVIDAKFLQNGRFALFCSNGETLKLKSLREEDGYQGSCELYGGHSDIIITIDKFYPNKKDESQAFLVSGAKDYEIRIWAFNGNNRLNERIWCLAVLKGHTDNLCSVAFAPKHGKSIVSSAQDNTIKVWHLEDVNLSAASFNRANASEPLEITQANLTVMAHKKYINAVKYAPNDKMIASASQDKTVKLWSADSLQHIGTLAGHRKNVWDIAFSKHDKSIATVSGDKLVKVWNISDAAKPQCTATLQGHQEQLSKVIWINAGLQLLTAGLDGVVKLWNLKKQQCVTTF